MARAEDISSPPHPLRWLILSALGASMIAATAAILRRRKYQPSVPPMSEDWMRSHGLDSGRKGDEY